MKNKILIIRHGEVILKEIQELPKGAKLVEENSKIWEYMIPKKMPLDDELDFKKISVHEINGGIIKNAVLSAARKAVSRNKLVSTDIVTEAVLEEIEDLLKFKNSKDHS